MKSPIYQFTGEEYEDLVLFTRGALERIDKVESGYELSVARSNLQRALSVLEQDREPNSN